MLNLFYFAWDPGRGVEEGKTSLPFPTFGAHTTQVTYIITSEGPQGGGGKGSRRGSNPGVVR